MNNEIIYLDNAASSWPKPRQVMEVMNAYMIECGANPGRGSYYQSLQASRAVFQTRKLTAQLFGVNNPNDIVFTLNTTHALNLSILGFLKENDHVICTNIEHNSVSRPLEYLKINRKIEVSYVYSDVEGQMNIKKIENEFKKNTRLVIANHSSNLLGSILPLSELADVAKKHKCKLLVDAAQTAGSLPIDVAEIGIDMLAFPGHKGLLGPQGTGGLYIHPGIELDPLMYGGTGSFSESLVQPNTRPDCYESGTQNTVGIVGLGEGIQYITSQSIQQIHTKQWNQTQKIIESMMILGEIHVLGPKLGRNRTGIVSFTVNGKDASEVAFMLDKQFNIAVRAGLHCTPLAHRLAGTIDQGAIRVSVGCYTTDSEIEQFIHAMTYITRH
jgi:cysteine desulfurase family protein